VAHDTVQVDLRSGEQLGEAYRAINPLCTVPALRTDDGAVLTDNAAITAYVEARSPIRRCWAPRRWRRPRSPAGTGASSSRAYLAIAEALRNSTPAMANRALPGPVDYPQIPALAQRGLAAGAAVHGHAERRLAGRDFVATDRFSIADITAVVAVDFARIVKVKPGEQHPHLLRWRAARWQALRAPHWPPRSPAAGGDAARLHPVGQRLCHGHPHEPPG
jgi:glutathione S-transferase